MPDSLTIFSAVVIVLIMWWALREAFRAHPFVKGELWRCLIQLLIAMAWGAPVWLFGETDNRTARFAGTLLCGFGGLWLTMKVYAWLRYGKGASVRMD